MSSYRRPGGRRGCVPTPPVGRWIVALPAWGDRCVDVAMRHVIPSLCAALRELGRPAVVVAWTDQVDRLSQLFRWEEGAISVVFSGVPGADRAFGSLSDCHRQALESAQPGDRVLLLTADMVLSREVLATCERYIAAGMQLVCCVAPRALEDARPPIAASGRELMRWAWDNRHPMTRDCTWPEGKSYDVWRMYFERDGEVAARVFLPHPLVAVPSGRRLPFSPTIDVNLAANFSPAVTVLLTSPDEGAAVELSPVDKEYVKSEQTMRARLESGTESCPQIARCGNARHRMFFGKRVVLCGSGGACDDDEMVKRILG